MTGLFLVALVGAPATAQQRLHVGELIGELPDTSNWPHPAAPDGNPFPRSTASAAEIQQRDRIAQLGKALFWDEQVSTDNTMACGTCHAPRAGGTDDRRGAVHGNGNLGAFGVIAQSPQNGNPRPFYGFSAQPTRGIDRQVTPVSAPTMIGAYLFGQLFWDRRAGPAFDDGAGNVLANFDDWAALEDLAVEPPMSEVEMGHEGHAWATGLLQEKLNGAAPLAMVRPSTVPPDLLWFVGVGTNYFDVFNDVFGSHPQFGGNQGVTRERFAMAIAHYQRTLIPDQAPIDTGTMTPEQIAGFALLSTRGACFACHSVSGNPQLGGSGTVNPFDNLFSDGQLHNIRLPGQPPRKTATLRNVGLHTKFFSTGHGSDGVQNIRVTNLQELIEFYNQQPPGLGFAPPLNRTEQRLVLEFLGKALMDPRVAAEQFPFDRPTLFSEANPFGSNVYDAPSPGPSPLRPRIIANMPPKVPAPGLKVWFNIGIGEAPADADAMLLFGTDPQFILWYPQGIFISPASPPLTTQTSSEGIATVECDAVLTPSMLGVAVYCQWIVNDFGVPVYSNAAVVTPF